MKHKIVLTGLCISLLATASSAESLRDSVEKALNTNPNIIAELKNQEAYKKYVDEREGRYLPTLDFEAYLEKSKEKREPDNAPSTEGDQDGYNAAIIFRQYLYDGGLTPSQVSETKHQDLANKHRSLYAIENTILETVKSYTNLVQTDERLILTKDMIKTHEENLVTAKEKEEISGEVLETYQVSSKLNFMTDRYIDEQDIKESGLAEYEKYVGVEPIGNICRPNVDEAKIPSNLKDLVEQAVLRNHRILEQIEKIKVQREKIAQYDATFLPSLNLELKASYDHDLDLSENGDVKDRYARLNFNWNLFNGNRDKIRSEQEAIFLQEQKKTLDEITNDVVKEVKSLYSKFNKNKQRIEALKKYVVANANIVNVYRDEFQAGTRTFVDILNAESELYESSKTLINVEYAAINNYYDILFNLSRLTDTILSQENQNCANVPPKKFIYSLDKKNKEMNDDLSSLISETDSSLISKELGLDDTSTAALSTTDETIISEEVEKETIAPINEISSENMSFLEAPKSYYTINIATTNGINAANNYVSNNGLSDSAFVFSFGPSMKSAKVLYGVYPSVKDAKRAMRTLSSEVLGNKPYIDNISKHQALYNKYN